MDTKDLSVNPDKIDLSYLIEFSGGNKTSVLKYINVFLNSTPALLERMRNAIEQSDGEMLSMALHTLKPQLQFMGIKEAGQLAENTEIKLRSNPEISEEIREAARQILQDINAACKGLETIKPAYM